MVGFESQQPKGEVGFWRPPSDGVVTTDSTGLPVRLCFNEVHLLIPESSVNR
jgi:hypothetical protein